MSQIGAAPRADLRRVCLALALLCLLPGLLEAYAVTWGARQGFTGRALRDGLDLWSGGFLCLHGKAGVVFDPAAYRHFVTFRFGAGLPVHMWSYPPTYLLLAAGFGWLPPWPAVLSFDALTLLLLVFVLRFARQPWPLVLAVAFSPAALENLLEGQNAALMTALTGGGTLLAASRPRLAGALIGLATLKPQLGLPLPLFLLRYRPAFISACAAALALALAAWLAIGPAAFAAFWHVTRPAMTNVLLTGKPAAFAAGLVSVFAAFRPLGVPAALAIQAAFSAAALCLAARTKNPAALLILCALASPYLHDYDLLGTTLAAALLLRDRLANGFAPGEALLFFLAWAGPGALPWLPQFAHAAPLILVLLLATAMRRDRVPGCDSRRPNPFSPASSAGR